MASEEHYRISGRVIDRRTKGGVARARVEVWDRDTRYHDLLGVEVTDSAGRFSVVFDSSYFGDYAPDRRPDLVFKVFRGERPLRLARGEVRENVPPGEIQVTLEVDAGMAREVGADRVSPEQMMRAATFLRRSDFGALKREAGAKAGAAGRFILDMLKEGGHRVTRTPIRDPAVKTSDLVGQRTDVAASKLAARNVAVREVKPYRPGADVQSVNTLASLPLRLKPGDRVDLYEENGTVRYYSVVREKEAADIEAADVARLDNEVTELRTEVRELDAVRSELSAVKASSAQTTSALTKELEALKAQLATVTELKQQMTALRTSVAEKDREIVALRDEITTLRGGQARVLATEAEEPTTAAESAVAPKATTRKTTTRKTTEEQETKPKTSRSRKPRSK
ncbi:MAG TPA: hypothetical protein VF188_01530 [Longimicrobiales bacterium]